MEKPTSDPTLDSDSSLQEHHHVISKFERRKTASAILSGKNRIVPQTVLVCGGAGFIGSHLCERLLSLGHNVVCLDNFSTGSKRNLSNLHNTNKFVVVEQDVTNPIQMEIDTIFNLACPASPVQYQNDPITTTITSVIGANNILELATRTGARLLHASTSEVYGDPKVHPQPESYCGNVNPIGPRSCYNEGKRCAESLCFDYRRQYGTNTKIVRIFNTYGPRMHPQDGRVISNFIVQALQGTPITVYGNGSQTRSFCYIDDMVEGLLAMMDAKDELGGPINLGNPAEIPIIDLAATIITLTNSLSKVEFCPLPQDDPCRRCPDITQAEVELGWAPSVLLEHGLMRTIEFFDKLLSCCDSDRDRDTVNRRLESQSIGAPNVID